MFFLKSRGFNEELETAKRKKTKRKLKIYEESKLIRAYSECLGTIRRRKTRLPAKSFGELDISIDPKISEWGNPA